jgi:hypothetical protein
MANTQIPWLTARAMNAVRPQRNQAFDDLLNGQFSLRMLFLVVVLAACVVSWITTVWQYEDLRRPAIFFSPTIAVALLAWGYVTAHIHRNLSTGIMAMIAAWHVVLLQMTRQYKYVDYYVSQRTMCFSLSPDVSVRGLFAFYGGILSQYALLPLLISVAMLPGLAALPRGQLGGAKWAILSLLWAALSVSIIALLFTWMCVANIEHDAARPRATLWNSE